MVQNEVAFLMQETKRFLFCQRSWKRFWCRKRSCFLYIGLRFLMAAPFLKSWRLKEGRFGSATSRLKPFRSCQRFWGDERCTKETAFLSRNQRAFLRPFGRGRRHVLDNQQTKKLHFREQLLAWREFISSRAPNKESTLLYENQEIVYRATLLLA